MKYKNYIITTVLFIILIFFTTACFPYMKYDDERSNCKFTNGKYEVTLYLNKDSDSSYDSQSEKAANQACELLRQNFPVPDETSRTD